MSGVSRGESVSVDVCACARVRPGRGPDEGGGVQRNHDQGEGGAAPVKVGLSRSRTSPPPPMVPKGDPETAGGATRVLSLVRNPTSTVDPECDWTQERSCVRWGSGSGSSFL